MERLEIIVTSDGSHTLRNNALNETYHSIHGAVQESMHVFVRGGLAHFAQMCSPRTMDVFEVGFGTGLNALLAWQYASANDIRINFTSLEPFPLGKDIWSKLNYAADEQQFLQFAALHGASWGNHVPLAPAFSVRKIEASLEGFELDETFDVLFFDAFAPAVQPVLWTREALATAVGLLRPGGVFVTYSARGQLKRDLGALGLTVETLAGPPGKNEMVRATRR